MSRIEHEYNIESTNNQVNNEVTNLNSNSKERRPTQILKRTSTEFSDGFQELPHRNTTLYVKPKNKSNNRKSDNNDSIRGYKFQFKN